MLERNDVKAVLERPTRRAAQLREWQSWRSAVRVSTFCSDPLSEELKPCFLHTHAHQTPASGSQFGCFGVPPKCLATDPASRAPSTSASSCAYVLWLDRNEQSSPRCPCVNRPLRLLLGHSSFQGKAEVGMTSFPRPSTPTRCSRTLRHQGQRVPKIDAAGESGDV